MVERAATLRKRALEYKIEGEPAFQKLGQNGRVFLAGYFYSGSGAVVDYLRGFEGLSKWPATQGDFRLDKIPGGLADLYKRAESEGRLTPCDVVDFYLHLTGSAVTSAAPGKYNKREVVNRVSRNILKHDGSFAYCREGIALFAQLYDFASSDCQNMSELRELLMHGLERMLDAAAGGIGANCLVIDQGVTAWRLPIAHLVPPSNFIIVHRDPRDQYVEAKLAHAKSGRKGWTVQSFADMYKSRRNMVDSSIATLETECGHRFLRIAFEDFVIAHEETSNRIRSFLRLGSETPMVQYFHPDISRRNIGKYRELMDTEEARQMENLLSEYVTRQSGMPRGPS